MSEKLYDLVMRSALNRELDIGSTIESKILRRLNEVKEEYIRELTHVDYTNTYPFMSSKEADITDDSAEEAGKGLGVNLKKDDNGNWLIMLDERAKEDTSLFAHKWLEETNNEVDKAIRASEYDAKVFFKKVCEILKKEKFQVTDSTSSAIYILVDYHHLSYSLYGSNKVFKATFFKLMELSGFSIITDITPNTFKIRLPRNKKAEVL